MAPPPPEVEVVGIEAVDAADEDEEEVVISEEKKHEKLLVIILTCTNQFHSLTTNYQIEF